MPARQIEGDEAGWVRLAERVVARRNELGLTAAEAVERAGSGLSLSVLSLIENHRKTSYAARSLVALCRALGWTPDSIDRMLAGGEPVEATRAALNPTDYTLEQKLANVIQRVEVLEQLVGLREPAPVHDIAERLPAAGDPPAPEGYPELTVFQSDIDAGIDEAVRIVLDMPEEGGGGLPLRTKDKKLRLLRNLRRSVSEQSRGA